MNMLPKILQKTLNCDNWIVYFAKDTQGRHLAHSQKDYLILSKRYIYVICRLGGPYGEKL